MTAEQQQALKRAEDAVRAINTEGHEREVPIAKALDAIVKCLNTILNAPPAATVSDLEQTVSATPPAMTAVEKKVF